MSRSRRKIPSNYTSEIISHTSSSPLHLLRDEDLLLQRISSKSFWGDSVWVLDHESLGADSSRAKFRWNFELFDGSLLTSPVHDELLSWLRRLLWSLVSAPAEGAKAISCASLSSLSPGFRFFVRWLCESNLSKPCEINETAVREYISCIERVLERDSLDERRSGLSNSEVYNKLRPLSFIWQQRYVLERAGILPMPSPPFGTRTANSIVSRLSKISSGSYRPLPDEVAVPILNSIFRFLSNYSSDVIKLSHGAYRSYVNENSIRSSVSKQKDFIKNFEFSKVDDHFWHWSFDFQSWKESEVKEVEDQLSTFLLGNNLGDRRLSSKSPRLPRIDKIRPYVDFKNLCLRICNKTLAPTALVFHPGLRSLIKKHAELEGLVLPSGNPTQRVRQLVIAMQSAAIIAIQATTGMRIGEVSGITSGIDPESMLPKSIEIRPSASEIGEVFILKSRTSKTEETPRTVEWTLGYRMKGSKELPPAVQAIMIVEKLMDPWRRLLGSNTLFIHFSDSIGLPTKSGGVSAAMSTRMRDNVRDFIEEWVDLTQLPNNSARPTAENELVPYRESHGRNFNTHQLRKLFANFTYRVDGRLLPILQMHFHHVSIGMTDDAYIMDDPSLLRENDDIRHQQAALMVLDAARGVLPLAGRFGEKLGKKVSTDLGYKISRLDRSEAYEAAFTYVEEEGLERIFFEPYGICSAISASEMACHVKAGTTDQARWQHARTPNYSTREPSLCAGCGSFLVAKWHLPYWEERYISHAAALQISKNEDSDVSIQNPFEEVIRYRMRQALALSRKLGADPVDLESRLRSKVEISENGERG